MPPIHALVLGAGGRGNVYGAYALTYPQQLHVTAVAEPRADRRAFFSGQHDIAPDQAFASWEEALAAPKQADVVINATMDRTHYDSTLAALAAGYDVLLEKPMSPVLLENMRLVQAAEDHGRLLQICHVLRYSHFWRTLREIVQSGRLGRIISVEHRENLIFWHMAHSFVRGNWRREAEAGPMILAKCCHDFDILHWILRQPVKYLHSFGSLTHFRPENAPAGATPRCIDVDGNICPAADACKYYAPRLYLNPAAEFARRAASLDTSDAAILRTLSTDSPYGRCVYQCDNDVVDHQVVNMELVDGVTVTLIMQGQGDQECRTMRWDGTRATLYATFTYAGETMEIHDHHTGEVERIAIPVSNDGGHGGGDFGIVRSFINAINGQPDDSITTARESLESHLLAFAAEESRLSRTVIDMDEYRARIEALARA